MAIKPKSVSVVINTDTSESEHEFKGDYTGLDHLLAIIDEKEPKWTSLVMVFCNPKIEK